MITKLDTHGRPIYEPGDLVAVANYNLLGRLCHFVFLPRTWYYHYAIIADYIESEDDYSIYESVNKGPALGRLSWYQKKDYRILRVNSDCQKFAWVFKNHHNQGYTETLGQWSVEKASKFGRYGYDFLLFLKLGASVIRFELGRLLRFKAPCRMCPDEVEYGRDKALVCTELVVAAWRTVNIDLCAPNHAPIPAELALALKRNELVQVDSHWGKQGEPWRPKEVDLSDRKGTQTISESINEVMGTTRPAEVDDIVGITGQGAKAGETVQVDRPAPGSPGPDLIARQGGQKRNRYHLYKQPFGYPIRACDWTMVAESELEDVREAPALPLVTCKHCQAIIHGKRRSMEDSGPPYNAPATEGK